MDNDNINAVVQSNINRNRNEGILNLKEGLVKEKEQNVKFGFIFISRSS